MNAADLWPLSYHLCGYTLLGATPEEPLGALPLPIRLAVLDSAAKQAPEHFKCVFYPPTQLNFEGGQHATYRYWRTEPDTLLERLKTLDVERTSEFSSPDAYFQHYQLYPGETDDQDEHWAERQFIERVFVPLCGLDGLRYLKPQVPFRDSRRIERRIDFVLEGERRYALEIEGKTYHAGAERFDSETARRRELIQAGFHYFPMSWGDVETGEAETALRSLIEQDALLRPLLESTAATDLLALAWLLVALPKHYPDAQRAALALLARASERGLTRLTVAEVVGGLPILSLALIDTLGLVERVADFYGLSITLPELDLYLIAPRNREGQERLLHRVLQSNLELQTRLDVPRTVIHLTIADAPPADFPENALVIGINRSDASNARTFDSVVGWGQRFTARWKQPPERSPAPAGLKRPILDYFARRYFQVPELKPQQIELLQRTLRGQDAIGILPTGFGKSLVFQLYALLSPRVTLVISPLKALIQDQVGALRRLGWTCVDSILSTDTTEQRHRRLADLFHGQRYRLFYIAPERLQTKTFYDELRASLGDTPLGALVIDEAHCVSEWGHDFRPAYLQIPRLRRLLEESAGRRVPLLALTATASELVRADMLDTLQLPLDCLLQTTSSDRRNLSLSVHPVPAESGAKSQALAQLLTDDLPRALGQPYGFDFFEPEDDDRDRYPDAGIVFAIYADPHGTTTFNEGTAQIAAELSKMLGLSKDQVRTHASRVPKLCPQCGSHNYGKASDKEAAQAQLGRWALTCRNCQQVFAKPTPMANWDTTLQQRHEDFKQDRFPLLVATKGFGMGIDKRNVSFVVHHAFSSGLEGYYQEAGRAGRANQRAHVALLYIPPTEACQQDMLTEKSKSGEEEQERIKMPRCMIDPNAFRYRQCPHPYNLRVLCDFSHQARFIQDSYPGVETDCKTTYAVYQRLKAGQSLASQDGFTPPIPGDDGANDTPSVNRKQTVYQLAIYRLQQLGIVREYTIQFSGGLTNWRFEVEFEAHWQPQTLLEQVRRFLERSRRPNADDVVELMKILSDLAAQCSSPPWLEEHRRPEIALLKKAIGILLRRVYARVRTMRLQMLRDQLDYARAAEKNCRRIILINLFNKKEDSVRDDYQCGFCDVCVPDLDFKQQLSTESVGNVGLGELVQQLNDLLMAVNVEPTALHDFVQQTLDHGVKLGMLARATRHLEGDPDSLPALYLAGALSWQIPARKNQALSYFRAGFKEGRQQGIVLATLLGLFYHDGAEIDAEEAVRWLNGLAPHKSDPGTLLNWVQTWEPLLGGDSAAYRALSGIAKVRVLHRLSGPLQKLKALATGLQVPPLPVPHPPLKKRPA
jgi:ATP-dependent DNA helicase RecQ